MLKSFLKVAAPLSDCGEWGSFQGSRHWRKNHRPAIGRSEEGGENPNRETARSLINTP